MSFNLKDLQPVDKANVRSGRTKNQKKVLTFRQAKRGDKRVPQFTFSELLWTELGMDNNSMYQFNYTNPDTNQTEAVFLAVPKDAEDGTLWTGARGGKTKSKTATIQMLAMALSNTGLIDMESDESQDVTLVSEATDVNIGGIDCKALYRVTKVDDNEPTEKDVSSEKEEKADKVENVSDGGESSGSEEANDDGSDTVQDRSEDLSTEESVVDANVAETATIGEDEDDDDSW